MAFSCVLPQRPSLRTCISQVTIGLNEASPAPLELTSVRRTIAVVRTFEFQNHIRYGSFSSSTCDVAASGRIALPMRRRRSATRTPPPSPFATSASVRYASAKTGIRSRYEYRRVRLLSWLRPPSTSTLTANVCHAVYDGHQLSFVGGFCASSVSRYAYALACIVGSTVYFRSVATLN